MPHTPDSLTRWLRALAAVTFTVLIGYLVIDPLGRGTDPTTLLTLCGALALWLGFEVILPFTRAGRDK